MKQFSTFLFIICFHLSFGQIIPITPIITLVQGDQYDAGNLMLETSLNGEHTVAVWGRGKNVSTGAWTNYAQLLDENGEAIGSPFLVSNNTAPSQIAPKIAMDANGNFTIIWKEDSGGHIKGRQFSSDGTPLAGEFQISIKSPDWEGRDHDISMNANGNFVVIWTDRSTSNQRSIFGQRFDATGNKQGGIFQTSAPNIQSNGEVGIAADGSFVVIWNGRGNPFYPTDLFHWFQRFDANGNKVGGEVEIDAYGNNEMALFVFPSGNFIVAWAGLNSSLPFQRFAADGTKVGSEQFANTSTLGSKGDIIIEGDETSENFIISWSSYQQDGSMDGVYAQYFDSNAQKIDTEFRANINTAGNQTPKSVAMSSGGRFLMSWYDGGSVVQDEVLKMRIYRSCGIYTPMSFTTLNTQDVTCESGNGKVELIVDGGIPPYQIHYGFNREIPVGVTTVENLYQGTYTFIVKDSIQCEIETMISLNALDFFNVDTIISEIKKDKGNLIIETSGGQEPHLFSIDGGQTFQEESTFNDLELSVYNVIVKDAFDCTYSKEVVLGNKPIVNHLTTYPNPVREILKIDLDVTSINGKAPLCYIYSSQGQIVDFQILFNQQVNEIDVKKLQGGLYFFTIIADNQIAETGKFVKDTY